MARRSGYRIYTIDGVPAADPSQPITGDDGLVPPLDSVGSGGATPVVARVDTYGQSIAAGYLLGSANAQQLNRISAKVASMLGTSPATEQANNKAVSGAALLSDNSAPVVGGGAAQTGGWVTLFQSFAPAPTGAPYLSPLGVALFMQGLNDIASYGAMNAAKVALYKRALLACVSRLRAAVVREDSHASVTYGGTWSTNTGTVYNSGTSNRITTADNSWSEVAVPADFGTNGEDTVVVCGGTYPGGGVPHVVWTVDGTVVASDDFDNFTKPLNNVSEVIPWVRRFTGLAPGAHTIRATWTNLAGTAQGSMDCWWIEAKVAPIVVLNDTLRCTAAGYAQFTGSFGYAYAPTDADVNALNQVNRDVAAIFTDGHVITDAADAVINKAAQYFTDGVHLNAFSAGLVAGITRDAIAKVLTARDVGRLMVAA